MHSFMPQAMPRALKAIIVFLALGAAAWNPAASAAEIRVLSSNAMTDVMAVLGPDFERATGHKLAAVYEPTNLILDRLKNGERADLVILVKPTLETLRQSGAIVAETRTDLARTRVAVGVRTGTPRPDIASLDGFKRSLMAAKSIAVSRSGASGIQFTLALQNNGILEPLRSRLQYVEGADRTGDLVADGRAEMAVQMVSELKSIPGIEVVSPLPAGFNYEITLTGAVLAGARSPEVAGQLMRFIKAPAATSVILGKGMEAP